VGFLQQILRAANFDALAEGEAEEMTRAIIAQLRLTRLVMGLRREDSSESGIQRD
jgi:hypothetical protein